jgi:septal ring factor EnvC (AmiA/AmiB activator)
MEKERQEIREQIKQIQEMYDQVKGQKKQTLGQLTLLQRKINLQNRYLGNINKELRFINDDIYLSTLEIMRLQRQLDTLKAQYAKSVVYAYKNRSTYDYLNFIFSASSFNDAIKRIEYLKGYRTFRQQQVNNIIQTQQLIEQRKQQQIGRKTEKNEALKNQAKQVQVLEDQKKEKDNVMAKLKGQEKDLQKQLADKRKRDRQLQNAITAIVRREMEEAKRKREAEAKANEKKNAATNKPDADPAAENSNATTSVANSGTAARPKSYLDFSASDVALNSSFEKSRGKLPWPVDKGVVSIPFGRSHVGDTKLYMDNPGITIATPSAGTVVKNVFDGEVAGVYNLGDAMAVTIRHGKYFTTYSNLSSVSVNKGDPVKTGQSIGRAAKADDGDGGQVDFILMVETKNVDPEPCLHR